MLKSRSLEEGWKNPQADCGCSYLVLPLEYSEQLKTTTKGLVSYANESSGSGGNLY